MNSMHFFKNLFFIYQIKFGLPFGFYPGEEVNFLRNRLLNYDFSGQGSISTRQLDNMYP
ncbi:hypothetical protein CLV31_11178 [Algoriphagus aquaeductus]|uniref:Uncharacterized protein n=1 Tax=Algoriphagus aquaeductus TaxID=475299 RepID=A0A326RRN6_9BACT|nr:hypothetical protein CLV31_11178 [Algoriphagus aquaeductus]